MPLEPGTGLLREALTSLHSLFGSTQKVLRRHGPAVARPQVADGRSFGELAVLVLNLELRPLLARWHPLLEQWEARRRRTARARCTRTLGRMRRNCAASWS